MNFMIIDITDIPHAHVGDEVILMGDFDGVRAHDLAHVLAALIHEKSLRASLPKFPA